jgi:hypothetical protein
VWTSWTASERLCDFLLWYVVVVGRGRAWRDGGAASVPAFFSNAPGPNAASGVLKQFRSSPIPIEAGWRERENRVELNGAGSLGYGTSPSFG